MEIQTKIQPPTVVPALKQYNQDTAEVRRNDSVGSGVVVDIQSRQEPLGVALSGSLQALVENTTLPAPVAAANQSQPTGPEGVATRLSSVAASIVATEVTASQSADSLPELFDSIRQSIDQGFNEAARVAADVENVPLQQARDLTHQQLDTLENIVGLRNDQT